MKPNTRDKIRHRLGCFVAIALGSFAVWLGSFDDRRWAPSPDGMELRIEFRETRSPFDTVQIMPAPNGQLAFLVRSRGPELDSYVVDEVLYPSGELRRIASPDIGRFAEPFDLDGDGVADEVSVNGETVLVRSGMDGRELFRQQDHLEYETRVRAFPLGDLDGDGFGELAVFHPRSDRSDYDWNVADMLFGVTSWITVVSGSNMTWDDR